LAAAVGARTTLLAAGLLGAVAMLSFLLVPGLRDPERRLASGPARSVALDEAG
jgi:hypothetical protein